MNKIKENINFIKSDLLYQSMLKYTNNIQDYIKAGFINENRTKIDDIILNNFELKTLPLNSLKTTKPIAVVVTTGSFSPLHEGHIFSTIYAKKELEKIGYEVPQVVLCFAHDNYVSFKNNGECKKNILSRINYGLNKIEELKLSDTVKIDHLFGQFVSSDLNFSTTIERIEKYMSFYYKKEIKVFYTFGSDNFSFFNAFKNQDRFGAFCFEREGSEILLNERNNFIDGKNFFYIKKEFNNYNALSSTSIRKEINSKKNIKVKENKKNMVYMIRENETPVSFNNELLKIFNKYIGTNIKVRLYNTNNFKIEKNDCPIISLDKYTNGDINIDISRLFEISSLQKYSNKLISLTDPNLYNIKKINNGNYILLDDDICSGFTISKIKELLGNNIEIDQEISLVSNYLEKDEILYDVVDARDFCLFSKNSGLVIKFLNEEPIREPYFYPFVNLSKRANIKPEDQINFTIDILKLNQKYIKLDLKYQLLLDCFENNKVNNYD